MAAAIVRARHLHATHRVLFISNKRPLRFMTTRVCASSSLPPSSIPSSTSPLHSNRRFHTHPLFPYYQTAANANIPTHYRQSVARLHGDTKSSTTIHLENEPAIFLDEDGDDDDDFTFDDEEDDRWHDGLAQATKMVGPVKTLAGMRNLLGDELDNIAVYAQRLLDSGHPILKKSRVFISAMDDGQQMRGLMILLISQSLQATSAKPQIVLKQRSLAEVNDLIYTAVLLHESVVELSIQPHSEASEAVQKGINFGNKMSILGGDFLLASACTMLARLYTPKVVEIMSLAIAEAVEGSSYRTHHSLTTAVANGSYLNRAYWERCISLSSGVVMANSCRATAVLGDYPTELADAAAGFGLNFGIAYQTKVEIDGFRRSIRDDSMQTLQSAPVIFAAEHAEKNGVSTKFLRDCLRKSDISHIDERKLKEFVIEHRGIEAATAQCVQRIATAKQHLDSLPHSEANELMIQLIEQFPYRRGDVY